MSLVIRRDKLAFEELYDRYSSLMLNYFYRMLWQDKEKAEDFMQDIFTKIIAKPENYNPERIFKTWLYSVANNMCKNEYKKQELRKSNNYKIHENEDLVDSSNGYIRDIDKQTFNEILDKELDELKESNKTTFIFRFREDLSIKEIGKIMKCSEGTVKSRLFYTIKKLTPKLKMYNPI